MKIEKIFKHFFDTTILKIDGEGKILKVVFNSKEDFVPKTVSNFVELFSVADRERAERILSSSESKKFMQISSKLGGKEYVDVEVFNEKGNIYIALKFLVSHRERELEIDEKLDKYAEMAELDPLTSLLNRYGYWERVKRMLNCGDSERKLGILIVDIDKLKNINDEQGHKAGDKAIKEISTFIVESLRKRDIAVRYGGDEFVIVVEELSGSKSTAVGLGKRLVKQIGSNPERFLTTVSVGAHIVKVGDFEKALNNEKDLKILWDKAVEIADEMAYKAKEDGRDRLVYSAEI